MLQLQPPPVAYRRCSVLGLPFRHRYERIHLLPELARSLVPSEIKAGVSVATVSAVLQPVPKPAPVPPSKKRKRVMEDPPEVLKPNPLLSGAVPLEPFLAMLHKNGITEVKVEETADGHILHLQAEDVLIQLEEDATHIIKEICFWIVSVASDVRVEIINAGFFKCLKFVGFSVN